MTAVGQAQPEPNVDTATRPYKGRPAPSGDHESRSEGTELGRTAERLVPASLGPRSRRPLAHSRRCGAQKGHR